MIIDRYDEKVVVYNPKTDDMRDIHVLKCMEFTHGAMVTYLESLISPEEIITRVRSGAR